MFAWWGRTVVRVRWWVVAAALALVVLGATWGAGVFGALTGGGYDDPQSEARRAAAAIADQLGQRDPDLLVLYRSSSATVDDPAFRSALTDTVARLRSLPQIAQVTTYLDGPAPALVSTDRRATYAVIQLSDAGQDADLSTIEPSLAAPGLTTTVGGRAAFNDQANKQTADDLARAEIFSLPVLLVLLVLIFRGLIAALSPLIIGGVAILGAFVAVRLLTYLTDISTFAINVITLLGLGMAVDYALFIVSRFREELEAGRSTAEAIRITVATAGRTVVVSGLTIVLALSSLLVFPQPFLRGMAIGGMAAVFIAMLAALTVLPSVLALLGPRINRYAVRLSRLRRRQGEPGAGWARLAHSVMRRPVLYLLGVLAVLAVFAAPFTNVQWGGFDEKVLPADTPARVVSAALRQEFPNGGADPIRVYVGGGDPAALTPRIAGLDGVTDARVTATRGSAALITVTTATPATAPATRELVEEIRVLPHTGEVLVGGRAAVDTDLLDGLRAGLPKMALIMAVATMILLFFAFGSILLPVKAVLMNVVSISASFGVVIWIFQEGHLRDLLDFEPGPIEPSNMILVLAVLFGLATDYEVFLLSRVREEWDRTGDNRRSVAVGLQRTGRIITAAALLLIVVVAGFATGGVAVIKTIGVGMIVAIVVDATLVRALLVPATMRLLGRWNWWAPGPLARLYRRYGIHESEDDEAPAGTGSPAAGEPARV